MPRRRFTASQASEIAETKYFRLRAGDDHKFIAVWAVVVDGRVLVRPWNDKPAGWYREFLKTGSGAVKIGMQEVAVHARPVTGEKLLDAMDAAYARKYTTKPNNPYVKGFATRARRATTLELTPA
ncbi:MAG TPA: DUF2255 family protein [Gemmatimonadaceae bacterium]|nr:DUF2255 family protein [Gemmatimonadaceae bacterium]